MSNAVEVEYGKLQEKMRIRDRVVKQLERSFMLQRLWPQAFFEGQSCKVVVTGNPYDLLIFKLVREDGSEQIFKIEDVPIELWPERVVNDVRYPKPAMPTPYLRRMQRYVNLELARISG